MISAEMDVECVCRRICQTLIFMPVPRIHNGNGISKLPWNCPEETRDLYRRCLELRYSLIPTLYSCAVEAHRKGSPLLRPLFYHHPQDESACSIGDECYLGDALLAAPVTEKGAVGRKVYLPEGEWMDFHTGVLYPGKQWITAEAPLKEVRGLPLFVRLGSVLVREYGKCCQTEEIPQELWIDFYPDAYGAQMQCHESESITNLFSCTCRKDGIEFVLENNTDLERVYRIRVLGRTAEEKKITVAAHTVYCGD